MHWLGNGVEPVYFVGFSDLHLHYAILAGLGVFQWFGRHRITGLGKVLWLSSIYQEAVLGMVLLDLEL